MLTAIYAALLGLLFVFLSIRTIRQRRRDRIALGMGGSEDLIRAARVHANFAEYVPLSLLLIYFLESGAGPAWLVHVLGVMLVISRLIHAYGVSQAAENYRYRIIGMSGTFAVIITACISILFYRLI